MRCWSWNRMTMSGAVVAAAELEMVTQVEAVAVGPVVVGWGQCHKGLVREERSTRPLT